MEKKNRLTEDCDSGATSSSNIASVPSVLNYSLLRRLPETEIFKRKKKNEAGSARD